MHEYKNEERIKVKYFAQCSTAEMNEITCSSAQQKDVYILQEDESDKLCSECKKKTSSKTSL